MPGHECYHCRQWVAAGERHDCWTTTEAALTGDLPEDLQDAWRRLRETAAGFGEQRIYASHNSIMFARKACYCFVRPKSTALEVCFFLGRTVTAPQIRRVEPASRIKRAHIVRVRHRDEVEPPLTDWLHEAYALQDALAAAPPAARPSRPTAPGRRADKAAKPGAGAPAAATPAPAAGAPRTRAARVTATVTATATTKAGLKGRTKAATKPAAKPAAKATAKATAKAARPPAAATRSGRR